MIRRIFLAVLLAVTATGFAAAARSDGEIIRWLIILFPVEAVASGLALLYLAVLYRRSPEPRSWVFRMLIVTCVWKVLSALYIGILAGAYLSGVPLPRGTSAPFSVVLAVFLLSPPIYYAVTIWERRREFGDVDAHLTRPPDAV